jgi:hypothetical protein
MKDGAHCGGGQETFCRLVVMASSPGPPLESTTRPSTTAPNTHDVGAGEAGGEEAGGGEEEGVGAREAGDWMEAGLVGDGRDGCRMGVLGSRAMGSPLSRSEGTRESKFPLWGAVLLPCLAMAACAAAPKHWRAGPMGWMASTWQYSSENIVAVVKTSACRALLRQARAGHAVIWE